MKNLITNEQVISLAFGDGEYLSPEVILDSDIASAAERYILPVPLSIAWYNSAPTTGRM